MNISFAFRPVRRSGRGNRGVCPPLQCTSTCQARFGGEEEEEGEKEGDRNKVPPSFFFQSCRQMSGNRIHQISMGAKKNSGVNKSVFP